MSMINSECWPRSTTSPSAPDVCCRPRSTPSNVLAVDDAGEPEELAVVMEVAVDVEYRDDAGERGSDAHDPDPPSAAEHDGYRTGRR